MDGMMGYFIGNQEVSENQYNDWLLGRGSSLMGLVGLGGLMGLSGLGSQQAAFQAQQLQGMQAMAQAQAQTTQLATPGQQRTARALAEFDWAQAANLYYLDWFFAKWGWEPFELA